MNEKIMAKEKKKLQYLVMTPSCPRNRIKIDPMFKISYLEIHRENSAMVYD